MHENEEIDSRMFLPFRARGNAHARIIIPVARILRRLGPCTGP